MPRGREPKGGQRSGPLSRPRWRAAPSLPRNSTRLTRQQRRREPTSARPSAQANVAQNATGYAGLLADADGVVVETLAEPGQVVSAGQVVIRPARAGQREARVQLPETLRPAVGSEALATRYGSESQPVTATLRLLFGRG